MIMCALIELTPSQKPATLRVYLQGSGRPEDEHKVIGLSISGHGLGELPAAENVDKYVYTDKWDI